MRVKAQRGDCMTGMPPYGYTILNWRHKLHGAVSKRQKETRLSEVIELDETYPAVSYKGNHSKNKDFVMPREPHKRGSQVSKRGLSDELLCIPCAVDTAGNVIGRSVKLGAVSYAGLSALYGEIISRKNLLS